MSDCKKTEHKIKIVNIGLPSFYEEVLDQGAEVIQLDWRPPFKQDQEVLDMLDMFL